MKHKSMAEMNRERDLRKAKEQADKDDENPSAYYKFLELFYKNKQSGISSTPAASVTQVNRKEKDD
jgi:adenosine deaminase